MQVASRRATFHLFQLPLLTQAKPSQQGACAGTTATGSPMSLGPPKVQYTFIFFKDSINIEMCNLKQNKNLVESNKAQHRYSN